MATKKTKPLQTKYALKVGWRYYAKDSGLVDEPQQASLWDAPEVAEKAGVQIFEDPGLTKFSVEEVLI